MSNTFADSLDSFIADMEQVARLRPHTVRAYRYELHAAALQFAAPLDTLTLSELERWAHRGEAAPSTVGRRIAALSRFFQWARRHDLCQHNPLDGREPVRAKRRLPRPIRTGSERALVERAISAAPQPYRLMLTLLRETGMRAGEVVALRIDDVVVEPGREGLRVREPKNGGERYVHLGPHATPKSLRGLRAHLKTLKDQPAHAPLFRSNRGTSISYDTLHYQWSKLCAAAGLLDDEGKPRYNLHQLRHTRGTELIEQGQRMEIVQRALGHRDPRSTQLYAELSDNQMREALERRRH
jgi:site-specific recombinase XerD